MFAPSVILAVSLTFLALIQAALALRFIHRFRTGLAPKSRVADASLPRVAVLLSLRGADPDLARNLRSLMSQDYPAYELSIVVDSETDPAWEMAHAVVRELEASHVR